MGRKGNNKKKGFSSEKKGISSEGKGSSSSRIEELKRNGLKKMESEDYDSAVQLFHQALELLPAGDIERLWFHYMLIGCLLRVESQIDYRSVILHCRLALTLQPGDEDLLHTQARMLIFLAGGEFISAVHKNIHLFKNLPEQDEAIEIAAKLYCALSPIHKNAFSEIVTKMKKATSNDQGSSNDDYIIVLNDCECQYLSALDAAKGLSNAYPGCTFALEFVEKESLVLGLYQQLKDVFTAGSCSSELETVEFCSQETEPLLELVDSYVRVPEPILDQLPDEPIIFVGNLPFETEDNPKLTN